MLKKSALFFLAFATLLFSCKKDKANDLEYVEVGGLFSLTGNWSSLGLASKEAFNLAVRDVNARMEATGSNLRLKATVYDTQLDTTKALQHLRHAHSMGTRYIIGPQSSAELGAIRTEAIAKEMLVISQSSTANTLAIANDGVFRFCPGDAVEGAAISRTAYTSGKRAVICVSRDDNGNKGLQQAVATSFTAMGGTAAVLTPYATSTNNFGTVLADIRSRIQQYSTALGADKVAVYLASFDEGATLMSQAAIDPVLASVQWYGGDGATLSTVFTSSTAVAGFAAATRFFAPAFGIPEPAHPNLASVSSAIATASGTQPDAYALAVYDAVWVLARALSALPATQRSYSSVNALFTVEANQYFGLTGPATLNAAGDRNSGSFDYWGIVLENGVYVWKKVGRSL